MTRITIFPQRLTAIAQPGALSKRLRDIARVRMAESERDETYLAQVRLCPCIKCGMEPSEAAHVRMQSASHGKRGGIGKKPADRWALSLCGGPIGCHAEQHKIGERQFWYELGLDPHLICERRERMARCSSNETVTDSGAHPTKALS